MAGHRSNHLSACGIHSDAGVVHVAVVEHGSSCPGGRSGEEVVHNHVRSVVAVHSPYNRRNVGVDDSHFVGCIHHFFWVSVSFVAFLHKQKMVKQDLNVSLTHKPPKAARAASVLSTTAEQTCLQTTESVIE